MLLSKVTIYKYKSFTKEQSFDVEKGITRIVGKNESGKTALLEVLAKSNYFEDNKDFKFDKALDYPRKEYAKLSDENPKALKCEYEFEDKEIEEIEEIYGKGIIVNKTIGVTTCYDNNKFISNFEVNFSVYKDWIFRKFDLTDQDKDVFAGTESYEEMYEALTENTSISKYQDIKNELDNVKTNGLNWENLVEGYFYSKYINKKIPKYWYFSDYFSLPYRINLNEFNRGHITNNLSSEELKIAKALFELSGLEISSIQSESDYETFKAKLEATSNSITDDMFEYWTSNQNLEIRFDIEHKDNNERYLNIRIYNSKHRVTLPLKNRSKGFLWFFSFFVWFSKIQADKNSKYILLLDEPGLSLHASAQKDLLRFIDEKLACNYQVIYTTHSPFMIDSLRLNEVRTVYDSQDYKVGSVISDAVEEKDSDTLFPLQAALGYTIAQNLYVSPKNLLVEGISDLVYINHFSSILTSMGKEGLNEDITIVPVGGADKIATFISLMRGNDLTSVCLLDTFTDKSAKARLQNMVDKKIIRNNNIIFYHDILNENFADVEDLFSKEEYLKLYNGVFDKDIKIDDLDPKKPIMIQLKEMNGKTFNHYSPANYLAKNIDKITFSDNTINNFEKMFKIINSKF